MQLVTQKFCWKIRPARRVRAAKPAPLPPAIPFPRLPHRTSALSCSPIAKNHFPAAVAEAFCPEREVGKFGEPMGTQLAQPTKAETLRAGGRVPADHLATIIKTPGGGAPHTHRDIFAPVDDEPAKPVPALSSGSELVLFLCWAAIRRSAVASAVRIVKDMAPLEPNAQTVRRIPSDFSRRTSGNLNINADSYGILVSPGGSTATVWQPVDSAAEIRSNQQSID